MRTPPRAGVSMTSSSDESGSVPYHALDESPTATSSPLRPARPHPALSVSGDSTTQLLPDSSASSHSLSAHSIFMPDESPSFSAPDSPQKPARVERRLERQERVHTEPEDGALARALEPLAVQETVQSHVNDIPELRVQLSDEHEMYPSSNNPNVTFRKMNSCELDGDASLHPLHAAAAALHTSTPVHAHTDPGLQPSLGARCRHH